MLSFSAAVLGIRGCSGTIDGFARGRLRLLVGMLEIVEAAPLSGRLGTNSGAEAVIVLLLAAVREVDSLSMASTISVLLDLLGTRKTASIDRSLQLSFASIGSQSKETKFATCHVHRVHLKSLLVSVCLGSPPGGIIIDQSPQKPSCTIEIRSQLASF